MQKYGPNLSLDLSAIFISLYFYIWGWLDDSQC